jgi:hypothetical protein
VRAITANWAAYANQAAQLPPPAASRLTLTSAICVSFWSAAFSSRGYGEAHSRNRCVRVAYVIPGDFIVFHCLRSSNQRGVEDFVIVDVASDFISFLYDAIDGRRINRLAFDPRASKKPPRRGERDCGFPRDVPVNSI